MKSVVVFGGGGFIGTAVVDRLLSDGCNLRVFERPRVQPHRSFSSKEKVQWIEGEFKNTSDVKAALQGVDAVVHLICTTRPQSSNADPAFDVQSNVIPTLQLLKEMRDAGVQKLIFISSGGTVYGVPHYTPIDEEHPTSPTTSYGITKMTIEKYLLLEKQLHGLEPVILRVANPYGERQRVEFAQGVVAAFLKRTLADEPVEIWGDGAVVRDYLHVSDVADAFAAALDYQGDESVFNIGSGTGTSLNDLVSTLSRVLGRDLRVDYKPARDFDVKSNVLCCERAKKNLGWSAEVPMEEGLHRTVDWLKANA